MSHLIIVYIDSELIIYAITEEEKGKYLTL